MTGDPKREDLPNSQSGLAWVVANLVILLVVAGRIQTFMLVCWAYGSDAYFRRGIRLVAVKPPRFTNGDLVPRYMDAVTGMATFVLIVSSVTVLVVFCKWYYERRRKNNQLG